MDPELAALVKEQASAFGVSEKDLVDVAGHFGVDALPRAHLLVKLSAWVKATYGGKFLSFPPEVTRHVFEHILHDPKLRALYIAVIGNKAVGHMDPVVDPVKRLALHQDIGAMVKRVLGAKVIGRSVPCDPTVSLVKSHSLLAPAATSGTP